MTDDLMQRLRTQLPTNELQPPVHGGAQRDAIGAMVDAVIRDICNHIAELRQLLDDTEQQILEGAAAAKHHLTEQINLCNQVKDELKHMQTVIEDIGEREKDARSNRERS